MSRQVNHLNNLELQNNVKRLCQDVAGVKQHLTAVDEKHAARLYTAILAKDRNLADTVNNIFNRTNAKYSKYDAKKLYTYRNPRFVEGSPDNAPS